MLIFVIIYDAPLKIQTGLIPQLMSNQTLQDCKIARLRYEPYECVQVWDWEGDLVRGRHLDASAREHYIRKIHHPSQILDHLYGFLEKDIIWRGQTMLKYRHLFTYDVSFHT